MCPLHGIIRNLAVRRVLLTDVHTRKWLIVFGKTRGKFLGVLAKWTDRKEATSRRLTQSQYLAALDAEGLRLRSIRNDRVNHLIVVASGIILVVAIAVFSLVIRKNVVHSDAPSRPQLHVSD